jgi:beta-lactamase regulating signal transducer with metallopeptidase domain
MEMNSFLLYLFEVSFVFAVLYLAYFFFFRWMTFHLINRLFLLLTIPISFVIPLIELGHNYSKVGEIEVPGFNELISLSHSGQVLGSSTFQGLNIGRILLILYCFIVLIFVFRLVLSSVKLIQMKRKSKCTNDNGFIIIHADVPMIFSCFNWIFVPGDKPDQYGEPVFRHEKIHGDLWHSLDLVTTEVLIALLWFNPFVFFFRNSIKSVHEYQVDSRILKSDIQKSHYLKIMMENLEFHCRLNGLYNYFNGITIKKRIKMITKNNTSVIHKTWYLLIIPLLTFLILSFAKPFGEKPELFPLKKGECEKISAPFGIKMINPFTEKEVIHKGVDLKAKEGASVMASAGGKIIKVSEEDGWGNLIVIEHGDGFETWYAHLKDFSVESGQIVEKGQVIGHVGSTGNSTGPHLHFEVRLNNVNVDPLEYVKE